MTTIEQPSDNRAFAEKIDITIIINDPTITIQHHETGMVGLAEPYGPDPDFDPVESLWRESGG